MCVCRVAGFTDLMRSFAKLYIKDAKRQTTDILVGCSFNWSSHHEYTLKNTRWNIRTCIVACSNTYIHLNIIERQSSLQQ